MAQMIEHLPCKHEALSSNLCTTKKEKKQTIKKPSYAEFQYRIDKN
jgi:hypothetical protein